MGSLRALQKFGVAWIARGGRGSLRREELDPALRGKPIIVVQTLTDSACTIAASYPA